MYQALYEPLPDLDLYLKRINVEKSDNCTVEYLDELLLAHQYAVPFENLDIFESHLDIDISGQGLFDKIVNRRRGGYCFELNSMFYRLVTALGYDAYPCLARVLLGREGAAPSLHRLTMVRIDGDVYVCDVGFGGPQPSFALKVEDKFVKTSLGGIHQKFKIEKTGDWWTIYFLAHDGWMRTIQFMNIEIDEVEFIAPNFYCSKCNDSMFVKERIVNLKTETGNKSILKDEFVEIINHNRTATPIENPEKMKELLDIHFGIKI